MYRIDRKVIEGGLYRRGKYKYKTKKKAECVMDALDKIFGGLVHHWVEKSPTPRLRNPQTARTQAADGRADERDGERGRG